METRLEIFPRVHQSHEGNTIVDVDVHSYANTEGIAGKGKGKSSTRISSKKTAKAIAHEV